MQTVRPNRRSICGGHPILLTGLLLALSACQPSAEERIASAHGYVESHDYQSAILEIKNALRKDPSNAEARALMARASYQLADFPTSADEYKRAIELGYTSLDAWVGYGRSLLRMGDAVTAFESVAPNLNENSSDASELNLLGDIYASLGNYADARRMFERAVATGDELGYALTGLAITIAAAGDTQQAVSTLDRAAREDESSPRPLLIKGNFMRMRGDLSGAIDAYEAAIERELPGTGLADRFDVRSALATTAVDNRNLDKARHSLNELEDAFPGHPVLHYLRGRIAFSEGDADLASTELQTYLSRVPGDLRAHVVMGAVSFSQNYYSQAEMYLQQAVRGSVGGEAARRLLAETRLRLNRPEEALELLGAGATGDNADASLLGLLGRAEFRAGNRRTGIEYLEQGLTADPDNLGLNLAYSMALLSDGRADQAIDVLERLPAGADTGFRRELLLLAALESNEERARALSVANQLLDSNPDNAEAHALVGAFKHGIDDVAGADGHFRAALALDAANETALFGIATLARERGDFGAAETALGQLLDAQPAYMPALTMLAQLLAPAQQFEVLQQRFAAAIDAAPESSGPRLLNAKLVLTRGDAQEALSLVREAREMFPGQAEFLHLEGLTLAKLGQVESALISLARAASAEPENGRYQFDLAVARLQSKDFYGAADAIQAYRDAWEADPVGLSVEVSALIGQREYDDAREAINAFSAKSGHEAFITVLEGDVELAAGNADEAVARFESAAESLWDRGIAVRLSSAYLAAGSAKAPAPLARWLDEHPDDSGVRRSYAQLLQTGGDKARAIAEYERVLRESGDDAITLNNLAWEYANAGRAEAVELARRAYELEPEHGSIADTYGWILHLYGNSEQASTLLRKAAKLSPDNGEIKFHLATVLAERGQRDEAMQIIADLLESGTVFPSLDGARALAESLNTTGG